MKKKLLGVFVCMLLIATAIPAVGTIDRVFNKEIKQIEEIQYQEFVPGEFVVKLTKDTKISSPFITTLNEKYQVTSIEKVFTRAEGTILDNIYLLSVPFDVDIFTIVEDYASYQDVVYAEPNGIMHTCSIPNDVNFSNQWALHNTGQYIPFLGNGKLDADIDAVEAWDIETGSSDIIIASVDSGIDYNHPDLVDNIWINEDEISGNGIDDDSNGYIDDVRGWDFHNNDSDPLDDNGHGTITSGIACAVTDNYEGIAGVSWNCKIMWLKAVNHVGFGYWVDISQGIQYAVDNGAVIITLSLGSYSPSSVLEDAVNYAYGNGVFLCSAVGNENTSSKMYPAAFENVTAVAATDNKDNRMDTYTIDGLHQVSNYGEWVDVAAPGAWIYSTMPTYYVTLNAYGLNQSYEYDSGTSYASPQVGGLAGLLLSQDPSLTPEEVKSLICENVDPYESSFYIGTGRINANKAIHALNELPLLEIGCIKGGFGLSSCIKNVGNYQATDVEWSISFDGGIIIPKEKTDTIPTIAAEYEETIKAIVIGLGKPTITVSAVCAEGISDEKETSGFVILFFVLGLS